MATSFPASLDTLTNPTSSDSLSSPSHSAQHANVNDAVEALQAKVGVDSSAVTSSLDYKVAQLEAISHGKILQVVRGTDTVQRQTTSLTAVDANISVTITPTSATSEIVCIWTMYANTGVGSQKVGFTQITDSSNVGLLGAEGAAWGEASSVTNYHQVTMIGVDSPATTSPVTYKGRFRATASGTQTEIRNDDQTGVLWALEVSA